MTPNEVAPNVLSDRRYLDRTAPGFFEGKVPYQDRYGYVAEFDPEVFVAEAIQANAPAMAHAERIGVEGFAAADAVFYAAEHGIKATRVIDALADKTDPENRKLTILFQSGRDPKTTLDPEDWQLLEHVQASGLPARRALSALDYCNNYQFNRTQILLDALADRERGEAPRDPSYGARLLHAYDTGKNPKRVRISLRRRR